MGTLFDQPQRKFLSVHRDDIKSTAEMVVKLAKETGLSPSDVIAVMRVLEMSRASDLYTINNDVRDEQLAGFGEILLRLCDILESGANA